MAIILPTHEPFLQTKAQVLVLPVSADGNMLHPVLARCKTLFADNYQHYYKSAIQGELKLGQVMINRLQKQHTGLGVQTGRVEYIANLITQEVVSHRISCRTLHSTIKTLRPKIYDLMRYHGIRRLAFIGSPLLMTQPDELPSINADDILSVWMEVFGDMPKLTIELHFSKDTVLPTIKKPLENSPPIR